MQLLVKQTQCPQDDLIYLYGPNAFSLHVLHYLKTFKTLKYLNLKFTVIQTASHRTSFGTCKNKGEKKRPIRKCNQTERQKQVNTNFRQVKLKRSAFWPHKWRIRWSPCPLLLSASSCGPSASAPPGSCNLIGRENPDVLRPPWTEGWSRMWLWVMGTKEDD